MKSTSEARPNLVFLRCTNRGAWCTERGADDLLRASFAVLGLELSIPQKTLLCFGVGAESLRVCILVASLDGVERLPVSAFDCGTRLLEFCVGAVGSRFATQVSRLFLQILCSVFLRCRLPLKLRRLLLVAGLLCLSRTFAQGLGLCAGLVRIGPSLLRILMRLCGRLGALGLASLELVESFALDSLEALLSRLVLGLGLFVSRLRLLQSDLGYGGQARGPGLLARVGAPAGSCAAT